MTRSAASKSLEALPVTSAGLWSTVTNTNFRFNITVKRGWHLVATIGCAAQALEISFLSSSNVSRTRSKPEDR